jgi:hypothetical protein
MFSLPPFVCVSQTKAASAIVLSYNEADDTVLYVPIDTLKGVVETTKKFFKEYHTTDFPVKRAAGHYCAETTRRPFDMATFRELRKLTTNHLMPEHVTLGELKRMVVTIFSKDGKRIRSVTPLDYFPTTERPKESEDMATAAKKPAAKKPAAKPVAKAAAAKKVAEKVVTASAKKAEKLQAKPNKEDSGETRGRKPGAGALIRELILAGKESDAILEAVKKQFPDSKAGPADVSWNRSKLKKDGLLK